MKKTLLIVVVMALIIGLCAGAASAKPGNGKGQGQAQGQELDLQQPDTQEFTDVENHWAKWAIKKAQAKGILEGYGDGTFGPEDVMTEAQALVILDKLTAENEDQNIDEDDDADDDDADVEEDAVPGWAKKSVEKAVYNGYIKRFHSEKQCERAYEFVLIAQMLEDEDGLPELPDDYVNPFNDLDGTEPFAGIEDETGLSGAEIYEYMMRLHLAGIVKGSDGNLNPNGGLKRAEAAVLMDQIEQYKNKNESDSDSSSDANAVESELEDGSYTVGSIDFSLSLSYDKTDETVTAKLLEVDSSAVDDWEDLSESTIEDGVIDICDEIATAFEDDANITLDTIDISFNDEDDISLDSFDYDVSSGDLN